MNTTLRDLFITSVAKASDHHFLVDSGHFPALEQPELLVEDLRAFYRSLR
jgi:pimeloyl-ACP methyl ester carboxylesterase